MATAIVASAVAVAAITNQSIMCNSLIYILKYRWFHFFAKHSFNRIVRRCRESFAIIVAQWIIVQKKEEARETCISWKLITSKMHQRKMHKQLNSNHGLRLLWKFDERQLNHHHAYHTFWVCYKKRRQFLSLFCVSVCDFSFFFFVHLFWIILYARCACVHFIWLSKCWALRKCNGYIK